MKRKIILIIVSYIVAFMLGILFMPLRNSLKSKTLKERVIYTITIDKQYINLRKDIDLSNDPIMKVYKGEKYQVVEYYEGNSYNWYKIIYEDYKTGWIASDKTEPWVILENKECK